MNFHLGRGEVVRGLLALKQTDRPLPLIIIKSGTFAQGRVSSAGKMVFMQYFQESPFHVLYLESTSGEHFMKANRRAFLGGLAEGTQLIETLKAIDSSELKRYFSEYHIGGISLGGNGVLLASVMANNLKAELIPKSVTAICPVIDLEESIEPLFNEGFIGTALVPYFSNFLEDVWPYTDNLQQEFPYVDFDELDAKDEIEIISRGTYSYYKSLNQGELVGLGIDAANMEEKDFYFYNNYKNFYQQTKIPTYLIHAEDDSIVSYENNLQSLIALNKQTPNSNLTMVKLKEGDHCAFNQAYGTEYFSTLVREIILKNSNYKREIVTLDMKKVLTKWTSALLNIPKFPLRTHDVIVQYNFISLTRDDKAKLRFKIFNPKTIPDEDSSTRVDCSKYKYSNAPLECTRTITGTISLRDLGLRPQKTRLGKNMIIRNLNTHAVIKNSKGEEVIGRRDTPSTLTLMKWSDSKEIFSF